jgi:hypothetical protein
LKVFKIVAGKPHVADAYRSVRRPKRFKLGQQARELLIVQLEYPFYLAPDFGY